MMMNRRVFSAALLTGTTASLISARSMAARFYKTSPSRLLQEGAKPLCPASVLWPSRFAPLVTSPFASGHRFSRSVQEPG
jgi:hypothetical protein